MSEKNLDFDELKSDYLKNIEEDVNQLEPKILDLEKLTSEEQGHKMYEVFRVVHSLKGSAGSYEFYMLSTLFHKFEDIISADIESKNSASVDQYLQFIDLAKNCIRDYRNGSGEIEKYTTLIDDVTLSEKKLLGKVLLVEPTKSIRKIISKVASQNSLDITILQNGATALQRILTERFDLIISSLNIDILDGSSLLNGVRTMKNLNQSTPLVLISSDENISEKDSSITCIVKDESLIKTLDSFIKNKVVVSNSGEEVEQSFSYKRVLCVEDDPMIQIVLRKVFESETSSEIYFANDMTSAVSAIKEKTPDIILLDYFLKDCMGPDILEKVTSIIKPLGTPVVFMTSSPEKVKITMLRQLATINGIVEKPFKARTLISDILKCGVA